MDNPNPEHNFSPTSSEENYTLESLKKTPETRRITVYVTKERARRVEELLTNPLTNSIKHGAWSKVANEAFDLWLAQAARTLEGL